MTIRTRRRAQEGTDLAGMTNDQLWEVVHFGALVASPGVVTYRATAEDQSRAWNLLKDRREARRETLSQGARP